VGLTPWMAEKRQTQTSTTSVESVTRSLVDWSQFDPSPSDQHISHRSERITSELSATVLSSMMHGTLVGGVLGAVIGSVHASWKDVPNEYGLRKVDRRQTLQLIGKSVLFWAVAGNGIYASTALVESFLKVSPPLVLGFWGSFIFVSGYASVKAHSFTHGFKRGALAGLASICLYPFWSVAFKRDQTIDTAPWYGVPPATAIENAGELKPRVRRTRPFVQADRPYWNEWLRTPDPRDSKIAEGAWDPPPPELLKQRIRPQLYQRYLRSVRDEP